jgi:zinc transporter ZupT
MTCNIECIKFAMLGAVFVIAVVGVALPWCAKERSFTLCNLFSGGVLLAAALCHLLDDAQDGIGKAISEGALPDFPWAPLLFGLGYLFMLMIEHSVAACLQARLQRDQQTPELGHSTFPEKVLGDDKSSLPTHLALSRSLSGNSSSPLLRNNVAIQTAAVDEDQLMNMIEKDLTAAAGAFLALTVHSVIEGLSIGTQDKASGAVALAIAIGCHKGFGESSETMHPTPR